MSVYPGWQSDLLTFAQLPDTAPNRAFLSAWHKHANSSCTLNPVDLTSRNSGSSRCAPAGQTGVHYQAYSEQIWTHEAFAAQVDSGDYPNLHSALKSGDPYAVSYWADVTSDLNRWQSFKFATAYVKQTAQGPPPTTLDAPHALGGWKALRKSVNHGMPRALDYSHTLSTATLRSLSRTRKVRL